MENRACPAKPTMSQIILVFKVFFLHDGRMSHTSLEPYDSKEICYSYPETVPHAVVRLTTYSWPVVYRDRADLPSAPKDKGRKEPMHVIKIRKPQKGFL